MPGGDQLRPMEKKKFSRESDRKKKKKKKKKRLKSLVMEIGREILRCE